MKIERLRIDLVPKDKSVHDAPELHVQVQMVGRETIRYTGLFPVDDFESTFERMMARAVKEIKGQLKP